MGILAMMFFAFVAVVLLSDNSNGDAAGPQVG